MNKQREGKWGDKEKQARLIHKCVLVWGTVILYVFEQMYVCVACMCMCLRINTIVMWEGKASVLWLTVFFFFWKLTTAPFVYAKSNKDLSARYHPGGCQFTQYTTACNFVAIFVHQHVYLLNVFTPTAQLGTLRISYTQSSMGTNSTEVISDRQTGPTFISLPSAF